MTEEKKSRERETETEEDNKMEREIQEEKNCIHWNTEKYKAATEDEWWKNENILHTKYCIWFYSYVLQTSLYFIVFIFVKHAK